MMVPLFAAITVGPYYLARAMGLRTDVVGRIGIALVLFLGALGHFVETEPMSQMIPPFVPFRREITLWSRVLELAQLARWVGQTHGHAPLWAPMETLLELAKACEAYASLFQVRPNAEEPAVRRNLS